MKEGDIVLCAVKEVTNTVTSVKLETGEEGTIVSSEIAPGRIKHMRQFVVPNKKIVCKVLECSNNHIRLSLRRVSSKEKKEVIEKYKQEQALKIGLRQILGKNSEKVLEKIFNDFSTLQEFVNKAKEEKEVMEKYIPKEKQDAVKKIIEKKKKSYELKYDLKLKCLEEDGLNRIKKVLTINNENASLKYISAGNFKLKLIVGDFKEGRKKIEEILEEIEKKVKKNNCEFSASEEK